MVITTILPCLTAEMPESKIKKIAPIILSVTGFMVFYVLFYTNYHCKLYVDIKHVVRLCVLSNFSQYDTAFYTPFTIWLYS